MKKNESYFEQEMLKMFFFIISCCLHYELDEHFNGWIFVWLSSK